MSKTNRNKSNEKKGNEIFTSDNSNKRPRKVLHTQQVDVNGEITVSKDKPASHRLENVEIGSGILDCVLVDDRDSLPLGRPYLMVAVDEFSGYPVGYSLSFKSKDTPHSLIQCIENSIAPKPDVQSLYGTKNPWFAEGLMERISVENCKAFHKKEILDFCASLGIDLQYRQPTYDHSTRLFNKLNFGLKGQLGNPVTHSLVENGSSLNGYCFMEKSKFLKYFHIMLLDLYARNWQTVLKAQ